MKKKTVRNSWLLFRGKGIALVAALLLVLQSLTGALASGYAASSPMLDAFGNPLCITASVTLDNSSDQTDQRMMPDCCTIGCNMFAPVLTDHPDGHCLGNPLLPHNSGFKLSADLILHSSLIEASPGSPRSPPFYFDRSI
ncbi:hypothetical protein [Paenochrobactrum glaciei]|uniref:hypothetical protein n=1 Tax=Paenochrobactrum glaciei TaxID=486407 RepID=UPI0031CEA19E